MAGGDTGQGIKKFTINLLIRSSLTAIGYHPFGMLMPGRSSITGNQYRYGFNGKENDNEVKGEGEQQDYGFRIYDPRLGKFLSTDPLTKNFPYWSPYHFASNNPIRFIDLDGAEPYDPLFQWFISDAAITMVTKPNSAKAKTYGVIMGVGGSVYGVANGVLHPWETLKGIGKMLTQSQMEIGMDYVMGMYQKYGSLPESVQNYAIYANFITDMGLMLSPFKFKTGSAIKVDLMGGEYSTVGKGWMNFDKAAKVGITDDVVNFSEHFDPGSVKEIAANNPQTSFLNHVYEALENDGTITVRGQMANKYFKAVWDGTAEGMEGYEVVKGSKKTGLSTKGYTQSDGTPLRGDPNSLNEIVLKKKRK